MALAAARNPKDRSELGSAYAERRESHGVSGTSFAALRDRELRSAAAVLGPMVASLKNSLVVFGEDGMLIHASLEGEQIYVPIQFSEFSSYCWYGPPAAFLASVDGSKTLLDAFRTKKKSRVVEIRFEFDGAPTSRTMTQISTFETTDPAERDCDVTADGFTTTLLKRELAGYSAFLPKSAADVYVTLSRSQLTKIYNVTKSNASQVVFELDSTCRMTVASDGGTASFAVDGLDSQREDRCAEAATYASKTVKTARLIDVVLKQKRGAKKAETQIVAGVGCAEPFKLALESGSGFRALVQKTKACSPTATLGFYIGGVVPTLSLSVGHGVGATVFFVCTYECPSAGSFVGDALGTHRADPVDVSADTKLLLTARGSVGVGSQKRKREMEPSSSKRRNPSAVLSAKGAERYTPALDIGSGNSRLKRDDADEDDDDEYASVEEDACDYTTV